MLVSDPDAEAHPQHMHVDMGFDGLNSVEEHLTHVIRRKNNCLCIGDCFKDPEKIPPSSIIMSLHTPCRLHYIPGGHQRLLNGQSVDFSELTTLNLNAHECVMFRQDLPHGGSAYKEWNIRLHFYADFIFAHCRTPKTFYFLREANASGQGGRVCLNTNVRNPRFFLTFSCTVIYAFKAKYSTSFSRISAIWPSPIIEVISDGESAILHA